MGKRIRIELRVFAACLIAVFLLDVLSGGIAGWSPIPLDSSSPFEARLVPSLLLYALLGLIRFVLGRFL